MFAYSAAKEAVAYNHNHNRYESENERNGSLGSVHKSAIVDGGAITNCVCECLPQWMRKNHIKYFLIQAESVKSNFSARWISFQLNIGTVCLRMHTPWLKIAECATYLEVCVYASPLNE